jgi:hypothetical protein
MPRRANTRREQVDDDVDLLDQLRAGEDEDAAHGERGDDAPEEHPRRALVGHAEVGEQDEEDEQVVERERTLDQVDRVSEHGVVAALERQHGQRRQQREREPADRPPRRLLEARLATSSLPRSTRSAPATILSLEWRDARSRCRWNLERRALHAFRRGDFG